MTETPGTASGRLSDILLATGLVTQEQIDAALRAQKRTRRLLGETLVELGYISEEDLGWALSNHLGLPFVEIDLSMLDDSLKSLLPAGLMREHRLLPMLRTGDTLQIAMADPTHTTIVGDVERMTGLTAQVCLAGAHQLARLLDEWLGPEAAPVDSSDDLLFRELTRPTNPLGPVFIRALREGVREILLDPEATDVRVRFRTAAGLTDQPTLAREAYDTMVERLYAALSALHPRGAGQTAWSSVMPFAQGTLRLSVSLLKATDGRCLVLEIEQDPAGGSADTPPAETDALPEGLRELVQAGTGLVVVTGTRVTAVRRALTRVAREINTEARRVVALEDALVAPLPGMAMLRQPAGQAPEEFITGLLEESHVEVAVAGRLKAGPTLRTACTMAACGRLILAWDLAPDPVTWVATMLESGTPRTMMALGLAALVNAGEDARGRVTLSVVMNSRELADAIRAGGEWKALHGAANHQGFWGRSAA